MSRLLLVLIILGMIFYFYAYLQKSKKIIIDEHLAIHTQRERIISDLHDDVGTTLSSLQIFSELASQVFVSKPLESKLMIDKVRSQSKELIKRMSDIIWRLQDTEKSTIKSRIINYGHGLFTPKNIICMYNICESIDLAMKAPEVKKNILLITKEAMNNIAKYSHVKNVTIDLEELDKNIVLKINDDRVGFDISSINEGNVIKNMHKRCENLGGIFEIKPKIGKGTFITYQFPIAIISHSKLKIIYF